jgi:HAE1 family hydrophobic/amphiphilic exporter-1
MASCALRSPSGLRDVLILSLTVVGVFAFTLLGVDRFPKVDIPTIVITTVQPGAAPEQIETEVTDKIEEAVNTISGIDELRSTFLRGRFARHDQLSSSTKTPTWPRRKFATR